SIHLVQLVALLPFGRGAVCILRSMMIRILVAFGCTLFGGLADAAAQLVIEPKHAQFDSQVVFSTVEQRQTIHKPGPETVAIKRWLAVSKAGEVIGLPEVIAPDETVGFQVRLPLDAQQGRLSRRFALFTDEPGVDRYRFSLSGFAYSLIEPEGTVFSFGDV